MVHYRFPLFCAQSVFNVIFCVNHCNHVKIATSVQDFYGDSEATVDRNFL